MLAQLRRSKNSDDGQAGGTKTGSSRRAQHSQRRVEVREANGDASRHALERLQWRHMRSPKPSLGKVARQQRH